MQNNIFVKYVTEMEKIDQELRLQAKPGRELINFVIYAIDAVHNYRIHHLITLYGYPTEKTIGKKALHLFWLLIQHQDYDLPLQENCLKHCNFNKKDAAYLTDRVCVNKGKKQIFGTQFFMKNGKPSPRPIENPQKVDIRRKSVGLETLAKYTKSMRGGK